MSQTIKIEYTKKFTKQYAKLSPKIREKFKDRQRLWVKDPYNRQLNHHVLTDKYVGMHSINVTGDIRALYDKIGDQYVVFGFIGTHSQLYG